MLYVILKFLHIAAVIVWVGGAASLAFKHARLVGAQDRAGLGFYLRLSQFYGQRVLGPAAGTTLLTGTLMLVVAGFAGRPWAMWGFVGVLASGLLGAFPLRRASEALEALVRDDAPDADVVPLQRRLVGWGVVNLLLLLAVVAMMVFKPT